MTPEPPELSPLERLKSQSDSLRGQMAAELAGPSDHFSDDSTQLLKFHGVYQQDDRDRRQYLGQPGRASGAQGLQLYGADGLPGGRLRADQLLAELDLCDEVGNTTLRITTRQGLQFYGVAKPTWCARCTVSTRRGFPRWAPAAT